MWATRSVVHAEGVSRSVGNLGSPRGPVHSGELWAARLSSTGESRTIAVLPEFACERGRRGSSPGLAHARPRDVPPSPLGAKSSTWVFKPGSTPPSNTGVNKRRGPPGGKPGGSCLVEPGQVETAIHRPGAIAIASAIPYISRHGLAPKGETRQDGNPWRASRANSESGRWVHRPILGRTPTNLQFAARAPARRPGSRLVPGSGPGDRGARAGTLPERRQEASKPRLGEGWARSTNAAPGGSWRPPGPV